MYRSYFAKHLSRLAYTFAYLIIDLSFLYNQLKNQPPCFDKVSANHNLSF